MNRYEFYSNLDEYKSLKHYGIIGQKWGTRRWQNADGTFNEEGKIRYFGKGSKTNAPEEKIGGYIKDAENAMSSYSRAVNKMKEDTTKEIANKFSESDQDKEDIIAAIEKNQDVIDKMTECLEDGNMKKYMKLRNKSFDDDFEKDIAEFYAEEMANKKKNRLAEYYVDSTFGGENSEEKIGMVAEYPIAIVSSIKNYKNGEQLIQDIDKVISTGDEKYSKEELSSIMSNKKKLATMMDAADKGDDETYNKMAKKIKDKDKEAIEKFMKDANNQIIKTPVDENIQKDIEKIGGFTKPKINKKYLNEDGTLNELGLKNTERNRKTSRVFASIFKGLRNANVYGGTVGTGILFAIMAATGVGMPAAISIALAGAATSGITAGVDHALYKKLEKRADNYYTELKTRV